MRLKKKPAAHTSTAGTPTEPSKPPWQEHLDYQERPNREDLAADHNVFMDSILEPVDMPRWLRGRRRRARRDKLSGDN